MMNDESGGIIMTNFNALRTKMYVYRNLSKKLKDKPCKGKKCLTAESLTFDDYKTCLFNVIVIYTVQILFENKKHEMYTVDKNKITLGRCSVKKAFRLTE